MNTAIIVMGLGLTITGLIQNYLGDRAKEFRGIFLFCGLLITITGALLQVSVVTTDAAGEAQLTRHIISTEHKSKQIADSQSRTHEIITYSAAASDRAEKAAIAASDDIAELRSELNQLVLKNKNEWEERFEYGFGIAYFDGKRRIYEDSFRLPVEINWSGFQATQEGSEVFVRVPDLRSKDVLDISLRDSGCVIDTSDGTRSTTVIDAPRYKVVLEAIEPDTRKLGVILGIASK